MKVQVPNKIRILYSKEYDIDYIGKHNGTNAFRACIPVGCTGFPDVCLDKESGVEIITGFEALNIINKLIKV